MPGRGRSWLAAQTRRRWGGDAGTGSLGASGAVGTVRSGAAGPWHAAAVAGARAAAVRRQPRAKTQPLPSPTSTCQWPHPAPPPLPPHLAALHGCMRRHQLPVVCGSGGDVGAFGSDGSLTAGGWLGGCTSGSVGGRGHQWVGELQAYWHLGAARCGKSAERLAVAAACERAAVPRALGRAGVAPDAPTAALPLRCAAAAACGLGACAAGVFPIRRRPHADLRLVRAQHAPSGPATSDGSRCCQAGNPRAATNSLPPPGPGARAMQAVP